MSGRTPITLVSALLFGACSGDAPVEEYYGTLEPFASEAVYFVVTDRFVDGDPGNNFEEQGAGPWHSFDRPLVEGGEEIANIGYLGGDFRGIADHAGYIAESGFTALWITPIVENPDEAFSGSHPPGDIPFGDQGKSGYHGYWGVNFFKVDEHLESGDLDFATLVRRLDEEHGISVVLDIVANHGSPGYTMPEEQPLFGEIYDEDGTLIADHQNLRPADLDPANPLHAFYRREPDLALLADTNWENPAVLDYFVRAYSRRIDDGVAAFRIDTIRHMPHSFWAAFSEKIRAEHPGFFMFGEAFNYEAAAIAPHTFQENGRISVLDFPMKQAMDEVFAGDQSYTRLQDTLHTADSVYQNPYELMTFYDNHDMPRMNADDDGFIDAHNWMFTARGIPVVYYGSEIGFRRGAAEHRGNRDYFGVDNIEAAKSHRIRQALQRVARLRAGSVALQRGLQLDMEYSDRTAAFFRVYQYGGVTQTALVLLNADDESREITVERMPARGPWNEMDVRFLSVEDTGGPVTFELRPHSVRIMFFDGPVEDAVLKTRLAELQKSARRQPS